jgi:hypothetical protein
MAFESGFGSGFGTVTQPEFRKNNAAGGMFDFFGVGNEQGGGQQPPQYQGPNYAASPYDMTAPSQRPAQNQQQFASSVPAYNGLSNPFYGQAFNQSQPAAPGQFGYQQSPFFYPTAPAGSQGNQNFGLNQNAGANSQQTNPFGATGQPTQTGPDMAALMQMLAAQSGQQAPGVQQPNAQGVSMADWYRMYGNQQVPQGNNYGANVMTPGQGPDLMGFQGRSFDIANTDLFKQAASGAAGLMAGQVPGYDESAAEARDAMRAAQAARSNSIRQDLLGAGFADTGKLLEEGVLNTANADTAELATLERGLTADRGALASQNMATGIGAAQGLLGQQLGQEQFMGQLVETARQFDNDFEFQKWATERGFDEKAIDRAWQDSQQEKQISSTEKVAFAGLSLDERKLAETGRQFDTRFEFDVWAEQNQLDEAQRTRVWGAIMQEKSMAHERDLSLLQTDTEKWKIIQAENLTKMGWDQETALTIANLNAQSLEKDLDRQLEAQIQRGLLDSKDKDRVLAATQFASQQEFNVWAEQNQISQADADRIWQSSEKAKDRVAVSLESSADRALQREVEAGRLSVEEWSIGLSAMNAANELEFQEWATKAGIDEAATQRAWESAEAAKTRQLEIGMTYLEQQFAEKNMALGTIMPFLETMDPEQAWKIVGDLAKEAGIEVPEVFTGTNAYRSELARVTNEKVKAGTLTQKEATYALEASKAGIDTQEDFNAWADEIGGFSQQQKATIWDTIKTASSTVKQTTNTFETAVAAINAGDKVDVRDARAILDAIKTGKSADIGIQVVPNSSDDLQKITEALRWVDGAGEKNRWVLSKAADEWVTRNKGKIYEAANGRLYEVVGKHTSSKTRKSSEYIEFRDIVTGNIVGYSKTSSGGESRNPFFGEGY